MNGYENHSMIQKRKSDGALEESIEKHKRAAKRRASRGETQKVMSILDGAETDGLPRGNPKGKCQICGKIFEQDFIEEKNRYTSFRMCQECKAKESKDKERRLEKSGGFNSSPFHAQLKYQPYPWQIEAAEAFEKHRFIVLACGVRAGKDRFTIMTAIKYFVECLNEHREVNDPDLVPPVYWWQIAPNERMARQNWRELKQFFPKEWIVRVSDTDYIMETIYGGIIEVRSGYDPQMLAGVGLDLVTITEAARFGDLETSWRNIEQRLNSPKRGLKRDRGDSKAGMGKAIINSSPLGKNDFYYIWCRGRKESAYYNSFWWSAQYPTTANPDMDVSFKKNVETKYGIQTYEETLKRSIGERAFRSDYLADFLASDVAVFKNFEDKCVTNIYDQDKTGLKTKEEREEYIENWKRPFPEEAYVCGYDPATGSSGDSPTLVVRQVSTGRVVRAYDLYGKDYTRQYDFVASICKLFNYAPIHWLRTGHTAIEGEFERRGIQEVPVDESGMKKRALVNTLEIAVENGDVKVLYDGSEEIQTLIAQMNDYCEKNGKYSNDKEAHDDFVSALYAAFSDYSAYDIPTTYCGDMSGI